MKMNRSLWRLKILLTSFCENQAHGVLAWFVLLLGCELHSSLGNLQTGGFQVCGELVRVGVKELQLSVNNCDVKKSTGCNRKMGFN